MSSEPYLIRLTARLAEGIARQPDAFRERHANYLRACQNDDGGFAGRDPASDLYYTGFGLRGLMLLGALTPDIADRAATYLRTRLGGDATVVDFHSLLYSAGIIQAASGADVLAEAPPDWPERVANLLASFRSADGGFGKTPEAKAGSTYHTFLTALCYEMLGRELPDVETLVRFVRTRQRDDGGFVEVAPMRRSGSNPTAAAVGVLKMNDALDEVTRRRVVEFLVGTQSSEGGIQANVVAPLADLLSTFTGCWTLAECDALNQLDLDAARQYVRSLERPEGGFHGGVWDGGFDVEYTFYGLGAIALLE
jgi:geranylgeranyl transferase type-2 subunit beta